MRTTHERRSTRRPVIAEDARQRSRARARMRDKDDGRMVDDKGLSDVSTDALENELRRRMRQLETLEQKRDRLLSQLRDVESEIEVLAGSTELGALQAKLRRRTRRRPFNEMSLEDALAKALTGRTMTVTQVAEAVLLAGYKTSAENFRTIVNQTLINSEKFKRVSRGRYTVSD